MYHAASGRRDYDRPGSFPLRHPDGRSYDYDFGALVAALDREQRRSAFALVACEPNWIYPLCNTIGAAAMKSHDRMQGGDRWHPHAARFRERLEHEFIDLAGRFVPCRSNYTGFALPMIGGALPQAMPCFFLNATFPDIALRQWLLLRRELLRDGGARSTAASSGRSTSATTAIPAPRLSPALRWRRSNSATARWRRPVSMRSSRIARRESDAGGYYRPDASVWAHAVEFFARSGESERISQTDREAAARMNGGCCSTTWPIRTCWSRAPMATDGMLRAVLYPGATPGRHATRVFGTASRWPICLRRDGGGRDRGRWRRCGEGACAVDRPHRNPPAADGVSEPNGDSSHGLLCSDRGRDRGAACAPAAGPAALRAGADPRAWRSAGRRDSDD